MVQWYDYRWSGPTAVIEAAIAGQQNVMGKRTVLGITTVAFRSEQALIKPPFCTDTLPAACAMDIGVWAGQSNDGLGLDLVGGLRVNIDLNLNLGVKP